MSPGARPEAPSSHLAKDAVESYLAARGIHGRASTKRLRDDKLGPAWVLGPEDRSNIETKTPRHVEIESNEPRPTLDAMW